MGLRSTVTLLAAAAGARALLRPPLGHVDSFRPRPCAASPRMQAPAVAGAASDNGRVCTVCVALLGQQSKIEDMLEGGDLESNEVDFAGFTLLVDKLEVQCSEPDKQAIFSMVDTEGSGTIDVGGLKRALRSSGAIQAMYDDSLKTFGLLLAATLAFDGGVWALKGGAAAFDFLAAYVVEDSLSVDNLFVFLLIFRYFKVAAPRCPRGRPPAPQPSITNVPRCLRAGAAAARRHLPKLRHHRLHPAPRRLYLRRARRDERLRAAAARLLYLPPLLLLPAAGRQRGGGRRRRAARDCDESPRCPADHGHLRGGAPRRAAGRRQWLGADAAHGDARLDRAVRCPLGARLQPHE